MSPIDAAWLHMDDDTQPMMITAVLRLGTDVPFASVVELVRERLLVHPRFRALAVASSVPGAPLAWADDPHFDLACHLHRIALPRPRDEAALAALISDLASTPLDRRGPLWQLHVVEDGPVGTTLVVRIHHAVGDGVSLVRVLLSLTDECAHEAPASVGLRLGHAPRDLAGLTSLAAEHATTAARLLAMSEDAPSELRGPIGRRKQVAFCRPLPLEALKAEAARAGATLNDLLLAIVGDGLGRYLAVRGGRPHAEALRAMVPVYFRGHGADGTLGNHFGLVYAPLRIGDEPPAARLAAVHAHMDALKRAPDALVSLEVLALMGRVGGVAERLGIDVFTRKASAMVTNVPGPRATLHLAASPLVDLVVFAPVAGRIGLGVTLLSYAGAVRVGVIADAQRVPDPQALVRALEAAAEAATADSAGA